MKKSIWAHHKKCGFLLLRFFFLPVVLIDFFYRVFGRFVTRGVKKRDKKNRRNFPAAAKKSTYLLTSLFGGFFTAPLAI
jgi:lauroyl/myristoyl acyltransferase